MALVGSRRALLHQVPSWVLKGASADLWFAQNLAYTTSLTTPSQLISITRASTGYAQWADGHLSSFGNNVPRITDLGLLVEQASTNLILQSQFPGGSSGNPPTSWSAFGTGMLPIASTINAPGSAYQFTSSAGRNFISQNFAVSASTTYAFSAYVESNPNGISAGELVGISSAPAGSTVAYPAGSGIIPAAGTRITVTIAVAGTTGSTQFRVGVGCNSNQTGTANISAPQLEALTFATSYIPTTSSSVTRAADVITLSGAVRTAVLAAAAARFQTNGVAGSGGRLVSLNSDASVISFPSTTLFRTGSSANNADATIGGSGTISGTVKGAAGFDATSMTALANGGTKVTSAHAWTPGSAPIYIGSNNGSSALNGFILRATFGPTKGMFDNLTI